MTARPGDEPVLDCLVVGGGPAGLTAAIYLARFHLDVRVVDAGGSRAALIPKTRNHAGFPEGISGTNLLRRMNQQAQIYGAHVEPGRIDTLERDGPLFLARSAEGAHRSRAVLLATGVVNHRPDMPDELHAEGLARGLIRYCPICDGYEVTDQRVAVIGSGERGLKEAMFLRSYTSDVTLISNGSEHRLADAERRAAEDAAIVIVNGPARGFRLHAERIEINTAAGPLRFASVYPALGSTIRSELAAGLGARVSSEGCLLVDAHQRTDVAGLYAAGDVVLGLDQISHAMGEGGVAATTIRNDLAAGQALLRA